MRQRTIEQNVSLCIYLYFSLICCIIGVYFYSKCFQKNKSLPNMRTLHKCSEALCKVDLISLENLISKATAIHLSPVVLGPMVLNTSEVLDHPPLMYSIITSVPECHVNH
ncbi:hypothetical protein XENOCAPTIV_020410 [Xenoophorus captivus]|uniref:Uncharacterized protein n=1 Tax=Xenoophorus captivus TaxID=1517983 RepID=A0ABV0S223_9TELE